MKYRDKIVLSLGIFSVVMTTFFVFVHAEAEAADVSFVKEYTYQASEADSRNSCRSISLEQIKRLLLEELGTFLISSTEVKDSALTKDQIETYTAGSVTTIVLKDKWDGQNYWLQAKLTANQDEVIKSINELRHDKEKSAELEDLRKKSDESLKEIEKLKKELANSKQDKQGKEQYEKAVVELQIKELMDKGNEFLKQKKFDEALELFAQGIVLYPNSPRVYRGRGVVYFNRNKHERALTDFSKAIELDPKYVQVYYNRARLYERQKEYDKAIEDCTKAIELEPKKAVAYNIRGLSYYFQKNYDKALADYSKAIELNPKNEQAIKNREAVYKAMKAVPAISELHPSSKQETDGFKFRKDVVLDTHTGLMWARNGNIAGREMNWHEATQWVKTIEIEGYRNWRLPTKEELAAFAKRGGSRHSEWFNAIGFTNVRDDCYWSSTSESAEDETRAGQVSIRGSGYVSYPAKSYTGPYVWPVLDRL